MIKQGDVFYVDFNPTRGHDQKNKRPAIALSNNLVSQYTGMTLVTPISTTDRNFPTYHMLRTTSKVKGKVLLDQVRSLDLEASGVSKAEEKLSKEEFEEIIHKFKLLLDISL
ncbi:MAG: type II toxin-antitoxin system PemK/MazF family toxin [Gemella sp.]|nr:type II toxin-antitoxin system PemK/MazF family toxin [Gemella sp.]